MALARSQIRKPSLIKPIFIITAIYLILRFIASFFPDARLWGFNQAAYIKDLYFIYPALLIMAAIIYMVSAKFVNSAGKSISENRDYYWIRIIVSGLILIISISNNRDF